MAKMNTEKKRKCKLQAKEEDNKKILPSPRSGLNNRPSQMCYPPLVLLDALDLLQSFLPISLSCDSTCISILKLEPENFQPHFSKTQKKSF